MPDLTWKPGPPPLDVPGLWLFETEGLLSDTITPYAVVVTDDRDICCACSGYGNVGRAAFINTRAVRHFGPIPPGGETT